MRRGGSKGRILRWGRPRRRAIGLEGGVNAGSTSAPDSAPPVSASGTARGNPTPASHADDSTAFRAPLADKANGSLRPAHTENAHWLPQRFGTPVGPATEGAGPPPSDSLKSRGRYLPF